MKFLAAVALIVGLLLAEAWTFMVTVGVVHGAWLHDMPTISYAGAITVTFTITLCLIGWGVIKAIAEGALSE